MRVVFTVPVDARGEAPPAGGAEPRKGWHAGGGGAPPHPSTRRPLRGSHRFDAAPVRGRHRRERSCSPSSIATARPTTCTSRAPSAPRLPSATGTTSTAIRPGRWRRCRPASCWTVKCRGPACRSCARRSPPATLPGEGTSVRRSWRRTMPTRRLPRWHGPPRRGWGPPGRDAGNGGATVSLRRPPCWPGRPRRAAARAHAGRIMAAWYACPPDASRNWLAR